MTDPGSAADHLRVIRNLMERATVYRLISAPTALVGGIISLAASLFLFWHPPAKRTSYLLLWLAVLLVTAGANSLFIRWEAKKRNAPVYSPAFRHALFAILPAATSGVAVGALSLQWSYFCPGVFWSLFYGLALLATRPYGPRSMQILAWFFFVTGICSILFLNQSRLDDVRVAAGFMALTFGLYHLIYGILVGRETRFRLSRSTP